MKTGAYLLGTLWVYICLCAFAMAEGDKTITITTGDQGAPKIQVISGDDSDYTIKIYKMLAQDLKIVGHFDVGFDDKIKRKVLGRGGDLNEYRDRGLNLIAQVTHKREGRKLVGVLTLKDLGNEYEESREYSQDDERAYPFIAHDMSIFISKYVGAPAPDWINRRVIFSKQVDSSRSEITMADYSFTYQKTLISEGLNVFPKWADKDQREFYYTHISNKATIYKYSIDGGNSEFVLSSQGMAVVSDVSSDYSKLLTSLSPSGLSDIYLYDVDTKNTTQLTTYSGIDVNANFINGDSAFVFVSDRLGYPNIFMKGLSPNANVVQLVFRGRNNSTLASHGQYVVFSSRESATESGVSSYNLYLLSSKSDYIRKLSDKGTNRLPRFSHDGDSIMYLKQAGSEYAMGLIRLSSNKSFLFPLKNTKIQSFDW